MTSVADCSGCSATLIAWPPRLTWSPSLAAALRDLDDPLDVGLVEVGGLLVEGDGGEADRAVLADRALARERVLHAGDAG